MTLYIVRGCCSKAISLSGQWMTPLSGMSVLTLYFIGTSLSHLEYSYWPTGKSSHMSSLRYTNIQSVMSQGNTTIHKDHLITKFQNTVLYRHKFTLATQYKLTHCLRGCQCWALVKCLSTYTDNKKSYHIFTCNRAMHYGIICRS